MRKNLSLILSLLLVLTLCLGGCNPSEPDESSIREESSVLEEASQMEESSVPDESSQLAESSEDTAWASAYLDIVEELQAEYGENMEKAKQLPIKSQKDFTV